MFISIKNNKGMNADIYTPNIYHLLVHVWQILSQILKVLKIIQDKNLSIYIYIYIYI